MATITVSDELGRLIEKKAAQHGYADPSVYVSELILRDKELADSLDKHLREGLESGISLYTIEEAIEAGYERARRNCA